jgi:hypothetical protein
MTAPPLKGRVLTCASKRRWSDEVSARAGAMSAIQFYQNTDRLWVYRCKECNGWHLTSKDNGRRQMVTADNPVHAVAIT